MANFPECTFPWICCSGIWHSDWVYWNLFSSSLLAWFSFLPAWRVIKLLNDHCHPYCLPNSFWSKITALSSLIITSSCALDDLIQTKVPRTWSFSLVGCEWAFAVHICHYPHIICTLCSYLGFLNKLYISITITSYDNLFIILVINTMTFSSSCLLPIFLHKLAASECNARETFFLLFLYCNVQ